VPRVERLDGREVRAGLAERAACKPPLRERGVHRLADADERQEEVEPVHDLRTRVSVCGCTDVARAHTNAMDPSTTNTMTQKDTSA
jgi:hypothetical protein